MPRKNLFGPAPDRKYRRTAKPQAKSWQKRLIGPVSGGRAKKLVTAVGPRPDPGLSKLERGLISTRRRARSCFGSTSPPPISGGSPRRSAKAVAELARRNGRVTSAITTTTAGGQ